MRGREIKKGFNTKERASKKKKPIPHTEISKLRILKPEGKMNKSLKIIESTLNNYCNMGKVETMPDKMQNCADSQVNMEYKKFQSGSKVK